MQPVLSGTAQWYCSAAQELSGSSSQAHKLTGGVLVYEASLN